MARDTSGSSPARTPSTPRARRRDDDGDSAQLIYEDPQRLDQVRYVILDEVHYIDDFPRGASGRKSSSRPRRTSSFIGLSATISNFQEVAGWMSQQRGDIATVT